MYGSRGLTSTEQNYAEIEKEVLTIVVGCKKFDQYIYGCRIAVETGHKSIVKKSIHAVPKRLLRMLLCLQKYDIELQYKRDNEMHIADALSRAYPKGSAPVREKQSEFCHQVQDIVLVEHLPIPSESLNQLRDETAKDQSLQILMQVVLTGWPKHKHLAPLELQTYFSSRNELSVQDGLLFKGNRVVIPTSLRQSIIQRIHSTHMDIEGSLRRAREAYYWPLMNAQLKDFISKCSVCNTIRPDQCREELMPHELPERPWSKVGTDLFTFGGKNYIVTVD